MVINKRIILLLSICYWTSANASEETSQIVSQKALFKVSTEQIMLPDNEPLGWIGSSYLLEVYPNFYIGGSLYGAATGNRGGFFSIGSEFTWRKELSQHWSSDIGTYIGGGGGAGANSLVGGGLVIRPHLDLLYTLDNYQIGVSASNVRFPYGTISSNQMGLVFTSLNDFTHTEQHSETISTITQSANGLGFHRIRGTAALYNGQLFESSNIDDTVTMLGMRADHFINPTTYWGIEVVGAAGGKLGGYGEYLATLGVEYPILRQDILNIGGRVGIGMAGGGGAATKGGLIAKTGITLSANLSEHYHLSLEGGYMLAPAGKMQAKYIGADLTLDLSSPYTQTSSETVSNYEWQIGIFNYHAVTLENNTKSSPFSGVEIRINRFLSEHIYHGLHIMYAAKGANYGGYGHTFADIGYRFPVLHTLSLSTEVAVGGGGGGKISVGGGALYMGNIYLDYQLNNTLKLRLGIGRLQSLKGALNTTVSELLITYDYSLTE